MPLFALGTLRRGNLWETTAMPEIREQAYDVARAVVRALHGETKRRPTDVYGLTLTTDKRAAEVYNEAFGRLLRLQDGVETGLEAAVELDPGFTQAHAALALLGHEWGATGSWRASLRAAHAAASDRHLDDRESSFLDAVTTRLRTDEATGAAALLRHVRLFPRDALAVSVALPTVAFGGLTSGRQTSDLVEGLARSYGDDWWYAGQLAFVRQDQERWSEAEALRRTPSRSSPPPATPPTPAPTSSTRPASTRPGSAGSTSGSASRAPRPTTGRTSPGTRRCTS